MKSPQGYMRLGMRMSDSKSMNRFIKYTKIKNFGIFRFNKMLELQEFFQKGLYSSLTGTWRANACGRELAPVVGNPHGKMKKSTWLNFLRRVQK